MQIKDTTKEKLKTADLVIATNIIVILATLNIIYGGLLLKGLLIGAILAASLPEKTCPNTRLTTETLLGALAGAGGMFILAVASGWC